MKKIYLISLLLACSPALMATTKLDPSSSLLLDSYKAGTLDEVTARTFFKAPASRTEQTYVTTLVETDGELPADTPYRWFRLAEGFYTVDIPVDEVEAYGENAEVRAMSFGSVATPTMDKARVATTGGDVDRAHIGNGLGASLLEKRPYKGTGVISAIYDTGFDPAHINWLSADGSRNRLVYYINSAGRTFKEYKGDAAPGADTDTQEESHGSHVAGIMAGAYNGTGHFYGDKSTDQGTIPLYGVAPESDMAIAAGSLVTVDILKGVRMLADYANIQGKPIVINLSLGNNTGPHDGTSSDCRTLDKIINETGAIIVVASGNDGDIDSHAGTTFTTSKKQYSVQLNGNKISSNIDCWSSTKDPFTVSIIAIDASTGDIKAKVSNKAGQTVTVGSGNDEDNTFINTYFSGSVSLRSTVNGINQRYNVLAQGNMSPRSSNDGKYLLGMMFEAPEGVRVDAYGDAKSYFTRNAALTKLDRPDANGSISDMATGHRTICIGSFNTRNSWYTLSGAGPIQYTGNVPLGSTSDFSSWGDLIDGRSLPHICAPGMAIISSYNSSNVTSGGVDSNLLAASVTVNNKTHYWGIMQGTSMAAPFAAGAIALWLEADPHLTPESALDILKKTANVPSGLDTKWGAGKISVYNGLKEVRKRATSGIGNITVGADSDIDIEVVPGTCTVSAPGAATVAVELYTISGALAVTVSSTSDTATVSTDGLAKGIYIVRATADSNRTATRKIAL